MNGLAGGILAVAFVGGLCPIFLDIALFAGMRIMRRERKRTEAINRAAAGLGYTFEAKPETCPVPVRLPLLNCGRDRQATNVLSGSAGKDGSEIVFDWYFVNGWGKHRKTYRQTVAAFRQPSARLPVFALRPEVFLIDKINELLGDKDLNFAASPAFSRAYHLNATDEAYMRALFNDTVLPGWPPGRAGRWKQAANGFWLPGSVPSHRRPNFPPLSRKHGPFAAYSHDRIPAEYQPTSAPGQHIYQTFCDT